MNKDKIKLFTDKGELLNYLSINGISGVAKDNIVTEWENTQKEVEITDVVFNVTKTSIVDSDEVETKED